MILNGPQVHYICIIMLVIKSALSHHLHNLLELRVKVCKDETARLCETLLIPRVKKSNKTNQTK